MLRAADESSPDMSMENDVLVTLGVSPNPADRTITVRLPERARTILPFAIYSSTGVSLSHHSFAEGEQSKTVSTDQLANGTYVLQIATNAGVVRKKIMILH
jgi:hypothetical protein